MRALMPTKRFLIVAGLFCLGLTACGGGGGGGQATVRPVLPPAYVASGHAAAGDVFVQLFEWPWPAVSSECDYLALKGYKAVQVSPPQEDIQGSQWWSRYQPVSYSINQSRSGTGTEFGAMVTHCKSVGIDIYVDAVINHMTAGPGGTGSNGTMYTKYNYPGLYSQGDFHTPCSVNNYQDAANVQDCELVGLADLNTGSASVQQKITDYLVGLAQLGVAGFRLDAAKHIQPVELNAILDRVNQALAKPPPYFFAEVIDYGGEAVKAHDYFGLGYSSGGAADITEFKFRGVGDKFLHTGNQYLAQLNPKGTPGNQFSESAWGIMPSDKAVVFLENHDTQRSGGISYRNGAIYRLANIWMLAQPYGYPKVMSSYSFDLTQAGRDAGPPGTAPGCASSLEAVTTAGQWVCEHRDPAISNMVAFRHAVAGTAETNWWDDGANAIAFSRGNIGFVAINAESFVVARSFYTGLAPATYCDVLGGGVNITVTPHVCVGQTITVDSNNNATISLSALTGLVLQAGITVP